MESNKNFSLESIEGEIWKEIIGYEGLYQISNLGRAKALAREYYSGKTKSSKKFTKERIMPLGSHVYHGVYLCKTGIVKRVEIHRLVAIYFIPNPMNKPCVNHKDGNKYNNHFNNLEWVTHKENSTHAKIHLGAFKYERAKYLKVLKSVIKYDMNMVPLKKYDCISDAARDNNLFVQNIGFVCKNQHKTIGGFYWRFV